jgi:hypothetical protein
MRGTDGRPIRAHAQTICPAEACRRRHPVPRHRRPGAAGIEPRGSSAGQRPAAGGDALPRDLPKVTAGNQSQQREIDLFNEGEEEAAIEKVVIEGGDSAAFNLNWSNCGTLSQGQHCQVAVSFQPGSAGEKQARVQVRFSGARSEESFALSGTGVPPQLSFNPGSQDFGIQAINGESQRFNFQLENDGEAAVGVGGPDFAGGSNGFWIENNDCGGRWMEPGESCSIEVGFRPNNPGAYSTQLRVNANGQSFTAHLSGEGGRAIVEATPNPADFGAATIGATGSTRTIAVSNSGNVGTGFFIAVISGGDAGSFHLLEESCTAARLQPSSSCTARVRFAPLDSGQRTAKLSFFGEGEGPVQVDLDGEGVAPKTVLAPSAYDFGSRAVGARGPVRAFAVRNGAGTPIDLGAASIVGPDLDQFALSSDTCTGAVLGAGQECLLGVRFVPDSRGGKAATLRIAADGGVLTASLGGRGVPALTTGSGASANHHRLRRNRLRHGMTLDVRAAHRG